MNTIEHMLPVEARHTFSWQRYLLDSVLACGGAMLVILALATTRGRYAALVAALVAFLSFDFFLVPPFYSFTISRWEEWIALFVFLATALIASQLATVTHQSVEQARLREREARILYEAGRVINSTDRLDEQLDSIALSIVRVFSPWGVRECALLLPDENGTLSIQADAPIRIEHFTLSPDEMVAAREVMAQGKMRELSQASSTSASSGQHAILYLIPLKTANQVLGVLCLRTEHAVSWFASEQRMLEEQAQPGEQAAFFWTFLDQAILVIERARRRARAKSTNE